MLRTGDSSALRGLLGLIKEMELNNSDGTSDDLIKGLKANHIKVVQGIYAD
jgi:hypothetical protein